MIKIFVFTTSRFLNNFIGIHLCILEIIIFWINILKVHFIFLRYKMSSS